MTHQLLVALSSASIYGSTNIECQFQNSGTTKFMTHQLLVALSSASIYGSTNIEYQLA